MKTNQINKFYIQLFQCKTQTTEINQQAHLPKFLTHWSKRKPQNQNQLLKTT